MTSNRKSGSRKSKPDSASCLVAELIDLRVSFNVSSARRKLGILNRLCSSRILDPKTLIDYHDILSFIRAYPDNRQILSLTDKELLSFAHRIEHYKSEYDDPELSEFLNSGIASTLVWHEFGYRAVQLLLSWYPESLEIDWDEAAEHEETEIAEVLQYFVAWHENDAVENDPEMRSQRWLSISRGRKTPSDLAALVRVISSAGLPQDLQDYFFEKFEFPITWDLAGTHASRSENRVESNSTYYQRMPLRRRTSDMRKELSRSQSPLRLVSEREGKARVRKINEVLAVRCRELYPLTYANPKEFYVYEPGRGLQISLIGSIPQIRLPLDCNFGAMLVRNGLPIGYGIGATLFDRVEIAINVFPAFRSGESSCIFEEFFRLFHHHFGSKILLVRSRQMGDGDDEPIKSGAFWFYYKLGFRAVKSRVRSLADAEFAKIKEDPDYRCSVRTLKRLAVSDVFLHVDPERMAGFEELSIANLGYTVTRYIAEEFDGDRARAVRETTPRVAKKLNAGDIRKWHPDQKMAFDRMALLLVNIADLGDWSKRDKAALLSIIRAKGGTRERDYVIRSNKHKRFRSSLEKLAADFIVDAFD
jgi:hypothetical protein